MKMDKQTVQYIVLGVVLVGLLTAVYFTLGKSPTPTPPSQGTKPGPQSTGSVTIAAAKVPLDWATIASSEDLAKNITRDPFINMFEKPVVVAANETPTAQTGQTSGNNNFGGGTGALPGFAGSTPGSESITITSEPRKLNWIDIAAATKALESLNTVTVSSKKGQIILEGPAAEVDKAQATLDTIDVEPPVPNFGYFGFIVAEGRPMAVGLYNGQYYQVVKGQAIPGSGWSVTNISDSSMTVTDGRRTKQIKAGGSK